MDGLGSALRNLREQPDGRPTNAGVSLSVPPFGRLCLRSLEIGYLDPSPQALVPFERPTSNRPQKSRPSRQRVERRERSARRG